MITIKRIEILTEELKEQIINYRRTIHNNPELSYEEKETSEFVKKVLEKLEIDYVDNIYGYSVIGIINGEKEGKTIALRADMDALPIEEETGLEFKSKNPGKMHACGHDSHTAILLGVASVLSKIKSELKGTVKLVFQPAEESSPNGGAKGIIETGILEGIDAIYGLHVWPQLKSGQVGIKTGDLMAASDYFSATIKGKGGHAAEPHLGIDAIVAAAQYVTNIQSIISRQTDPMDKAVITIGKFDSGVRYNVLAEEAKIEGTCRTFNPEVRNNIEKRLKNSLEAINIEFGTTGILEYRRGYSPLVNSEKETKFIRDVALEILGKENVIDLKNPSMAAEDFSAYVSKYNGSFIFLGTSSQYENIYPLHSPKFTIDEGILTVGVKLMSTVAYKYLNE